MQSHWGMNQKLSHIIAKLHSFPNPHDIVTMKYARANLVDLTSNQTIGGIKTFANPPKMNGAGIAEGSIPSTSLMGWKDETNLITVLQNEVEEILGEESKSDDASKKDEMDDDGASEVSEMSEMSHTMSKHSQEMEMECLVKTPFEDIGRPRFINLQATKYVLPDYSILTSGYFINFVIEEGMTDIYIPKTIHAGQDIRFFNTSSREVKIHCPFPPFNPFYSPTGETNNFVMVAKSVFIFTVVKLTDGTKLIFVQ